MNTVPIRIMFRAMSVFIAPSERTRAHSTYRSGLRLPSRLFAHALIDAPSERTRADSTSRSGLGLASRLFAHTLIVCVALLSACRDDPPRDNAVPDGGMMNDAGVVEQWLPEHPEVQTMSCGTPTATDTCLVSGSGDSMLITGTVLTADAVYEGGSVLVDSSGVISCVGCDCDGAGATQVDCGSAAISPALINAHDHLTYIQNAPFEQTGERYEHRHDWRKEKREHTSIPSEGNASKEEKIWGELRFVMGGAMSTNASGTSSGLLRNLDKSSGNEGLNKPSVFYDVFPLDDASGTLRSEGCDYGAGVTTPDDISSVNAYTPHVSEGIDAEARNEFLCLSEGDRDVVDDRTGVIHGTGLLAPDVAEMARENASLIWSPRTNISLYGDTARVTTYATLGVNIALGTDWVITGSMNMLRELQCVDQLNRDNYGGYFADSQIWLMATRNAAQSLGVGDVLGELAVGRVADIAVFADKGADNAFRSVIDSHATDVLLVTRQGRVLYGDQAPVEALGDGNCEGFDVCGSDKAVCLSGDTGVTYASLEEQLKTTLYPLVSCDGPPPNEPTCTPTRPQESVPGYTGIPSDTDSDGDGIPDSADNCSQVFNPIRPVDIDAQADADQDGIGDECDQCPVSALPGSCDELPEPDNDSDGVPNSTDNCPTEPNPDQMDGDNDQIGDACDFCPAVANPGGGGCPVSVYDIKDGTVPLDATVSVTDLLVTAVASNGFYAQLSSAATDYDDVEGSGIFIYTGGTPEVARGDLVDVTTGNVSVFHEQLQLNKASFAVKASGQPLPTPVAQTPSALASAIADYDGVLVELADTTVTALDPNAAGLFTVGGAIVVSDFLYAITPRPPIDHPFQRITGISHKWDESTRLLPRDENDIETDEIPIPTSDLTLLINELDYDQVGDDINEFVEIYNNGGSDVDLAEVEVIRVNGSGGAEYGGRIALSGTLAPGGYFVVGSDTLTVDGDAAVQREFTKDGIQNGPDAVALYDKTAGAVIDAVSYEGEVQSALPLVEGTPIPSDVADSNSKEGSLCRLPNGGDTADDATDFAFCDTPTPGSTNTP